MSPDGNASGLQVPIVSVRRSGIRWPKRRYFIARPPGVLVRWRVISETGTESMHQIEARFWRRSAAERMAKLLNHIETRAVNT